MWGTKSPTNAIVPTALTTGPIRKAKAIIASALVRFGFWPK